MEQNIEKQIGDDTDQKVFKRRILIKEIFFILKGMKQKN